MSSRIFSGAFMVDFTPPAKGFVLDVRNNATTKDIDYQVTETFQKQFAIFNPLQFSVLWHNSDKPCVIKRNNNISLDKKKEFGDYFDFHTDTEIRKNS